MTDTFIKCRGKTSEWLDTCSVDEMRNLILKLDSSCWTRYSFRKADVNKHVTTIPLYFLTGDWKLHDPITIYRFTEFSNLFPFIEKIYQMIIKKGVKEGVITKAMIARLEPHQRITRHVDYGDSLTLSQRCHWVIKSNPLVKFIVNDELMYWSEHNIYEINNQYPHEIINDSDEYRIHLIFDIIPYQYVEQNVSYIDLSWEQYLVKKSEILYKHMGIKTS